MVRENGTPVISKNVVAILQVLKKTSSACTSASFSDCTIAAVSWCCLLVQDLTLSKAGDTLFAKLVRSSPQHMMLETMKDR